MKIDSDLLLWFYLLTTRRMEKLVELLNEYEKSKYRISWSYELEIDDETGEPTWWIIDSSEDYFEVTSYYITMKIISKRFWFIERLVKNDKVDFKKLHSEEWYYKLVIICDFNTDLRYDVLLMILSIQDNPIECLCSILKE